MSCYSIIAMRVKERTRAADKMQEMLTKYGCYIKTRLGLHDVGDDFCANDGIVILQVCGEQKELDEMLLALNGLDGVTAKMISLEE